MARAVAGTWVAAVLLGFLASSSMGEGDGNPTIESIRFRGNDHVPSGALLRAMRMKQPVWWNPFRETPYLGPDYLSIDLYRVLDVYRDRGYPLATIVRADVLTREASPKVDIEIELREGPFCLVRAVEIAGVGSGMRDRVERAASIETGKAYSKKDCEKARGRIADAYGREGFLGATVHHDLEVQEDGLIVRFRVSEGPLYRLRTVVIDTSAGTLNKTRPEVIRREVTIRPGERLRTDRILSTQEKIYETGIFRTVRVLPVMDSTGAPAADLQIIAHERPSGWYGFGLGYSSDDRVRFVADWGNRNVSGMARRLEADGDLAYPLDRNPPAGRPPLRSAQAQIRYTEPWILGTRTRNVLGLYHTYENERTFDQNITGLEETLERPVGRTAKVALGVTNKWVRTGDETAASGRYVTRNLSTRYQQDRRDNPLDPQLGSLFEALGEYTGGLLGGRAEFSRWSGSLAHYLPLGRRWTFAARIRAGVIYPVGLGVSNTEDTLHVARIPFEERFRLGGGTTVRGYSEGSLGRVGAEGQVLGGSALFLANAELRFPIYWLIHGAVFADAGNVWADPEEVKLARFVDGFDEDRPSVTNVRYAIGGGLRFQTPVGPFRVDYGVRVGSGLGAGGRNGELHLSLGQAF